MTNLLIEAIKSRVETVIREGIEVPGPPEDETSTELILVRPTIFKGYLPPKLAPDRDNPPEFPHIIIRPAEGSMRIQPEFNLVQVKFLLGGFSEDATGYEWLMTVLDCLSLNFQEYPVFEMQYEFQNDLRWKLFDDQPYPFWIAEAIGSWSVINPQNIQFQEDL